MYMRKEHHTIMPCPEIRICLCVSKSHVRLDMTLCENMLLFFILVELLPIEICA